MKSVGVNACDNTFWLMNENYFIYLFIVIIPFLYRLITVAELMTTILLFAHF